MPDIQCIDIELSSTQGAKITDANQTGLDPVGDFSIESWLKLEQLPSIATTNFTILTKTDAALATTSWICQILPGGDQFQLYYEDAAGLVTNQQSVHDRLSALIWFHFAVTVDVSLKKIKFYLNGLLMGLVATTTFATSVRDSANDIGIGIIPDTSINLFDGKMFDTRFWTDIRTPEEVADNMHNTLVGNEAGLAANWMWNGNYLDKTSNNNDLTAVATPTFPNDIPFEPTLENYLKRNRPLSGRLSLVA